MYATVVKLLINEESGELLIERPNGYISTIVIKDGVIKEGEEYEQGETSV